jgi:hypothetical protein
MVDALVTAIVATSLAMGAWCLLTGYRDRTLGLAHVIGLAVVELVVLAQVAVAIARLVGGARPTSLPTFIGYLLGAAAILPAGVWLASMERTKWGAVIAGFASVVLAVLALRLRQVWGG